MHIRGIHILRRGIGLYVYTGLLWHSFSWTFCPVLTCPEFDPDDGAPIAYAGIFGLGALKSRPASQL